MMRIAPVALLLAPALAPLGPVPGQEDANPDRSGMQEWMRFASPGEGHARLAPLEGSWKLVMRTPGESGDVESAGRAVFRWKMGGRFLVEEVEASLGGEPFEWMGLHGFDNAKERYVSSWIDNLGTGIDRMEGTWDEASKSIVYVGDAEGPGAGGAKVEWAIRLAAKDRFTVEMTTVAPDGARTRDLEIVATR